VPKLWPTDVIRELLALADATGRSEAVLSSVREAELFRFAIYSFRRHADVGWDLSVTLDETKVIVTKRLPPSVTIVQDTSAAAE
jgi:hypothetical protein